MPFHFVCFLLLLFFFNGEAGREQELRPSSISFFFLILSKPFREICFPSEIRVVAFIPDSCTKCLQYFGIFSISDRPTSLLPFVLRLQRSVARTNGSLLVPFHSRKAENKKNDFTKKTTTCGGCSFRRRGCRRDRLCVFSSVSTLRSGSLAQLRWPNFSRRVPGGAPPLPPPSSWHVRADTSWTPATSLCCFSARSPGSRQASVFKHHLPRSSVFSRPRPSLHHLTSPSSQIHFIDSEGHPIVSSR